jgi:hypothetical protein
MYSAYAILDYFGTKNQTFNTFLTEKRFLCTSKKNKNEKNFLPILHQPSFAISLHQ